MLRLLIDARVTAGGVGRYARDLVTALRSSPDAPALDLVGPSALVPPFTPWGRASIALKASRGNFDLVHGLHIEAPSFGHTPAVVTVHDLIPLRVPGSMPRSWQRGLYRRILERSVHRARGVIVPSELTADELAGFGVPRDTIHVVPHGISERFRPATDQERTAARVRFGAGRPYVAALASTRPHKNLHGLLAAATEIARAGEVSVVTFGDDIEARDGITSLGHLEDDVLQQVYAGAELFLLPSRAEGFGLPVLESLACGTPVVCGDNVGALRYLGEGAVIGDVEDPSALAATVLGLLQDEGRRTGLAEAGRRAAAALTLARLAGATLAVYRAALGEDG